MFETYKNRRVLITGHTGFKGSWLTLWLNWLGAEVTGYALMPDTTPSLFESLKIGRKCHSVIGDISDTKKLGDIFEKYKPEIVFHLAAQPLVRKSYWEPVQTYQTNVMGTLNVLEASRKTGSVKAFVCVTTDKCYENKEQTVFYKESDPMGGYDMYSSSKACAEILSSSYRRSFLQSGKPFSLATARAGNVIGGGDWASDRLIPDCIRNIVENKAIEIRSPDAIRPWQYVLEPLYGYLLLGENLINNGNKYGQGFNFGPEGTNLLTVAEIVEEILLLYGKGKYLINKKDDLHEANLLMLDIDKAKKVLFWKPIYNINQALESTVEWYKHYYDGKDMLNFSLDQIKHFSEFIKL